MFSFLSDEDERKFFIFIVLFFAIISFVIIPIMTNMNYMTAFFLFILIYSFMISHFILKVDKIETLVAMVLIMLAFDLIMPPYLVDMNSGITATNNAALVSSDVFIYSLLPQYLPNRVKFFITYVLFPAFLLFIARAIVSKGKYYDLLKREV